MDKAGFRTVEFYRSHNRKVETNRKLSRQDILQFGPDETVVVLDGCVYNISSYLPHHPGGSEVLKALASEDITAEYMKIHPWVSKDIIASLKVGEVDEPAQTVSRIDSVIHSVIKKFKRH